VRDARGSAFRARCASSRCRRVVAALSVPRAHSRQVEYDYFGETRRQELMPGGGRVPVTNENRHEYVRVYTQWLLERSVAAQFEAFREGFLEVRAG
jgi:HECT-domain (ubiquitin-transferase)